MAQSAQRSCGCPWIPGSVQGQAGWDLEQPGMMEGIPSMAGTPLTVPGAPSSVQPGLGHFQGSRGSHSCSGHPVPGPPSQGGMQSVICGSTVCEPHPVRCFCVKKSIRQCGSPSSPPWDTQLKLGHHLLQSSVTNTSCMATLLPAKIPAKNPDPNNSSSSSGLSATPTSILSGPRKM